MAEWTRMLVQDIPLRPILCDWGRQRFTGHIGVHPGSTVLDPLLDVMLTRRLTTCRLEPGRFDSRLNMPISFAAYLAEWRSKTISADLHEHELVFVMSGSPWRDDDTPVESHDDLWELMGYFRLDVAPKAPPRVRQKRRDSGQPRKRKGAPLETQG